MVVTFTYRVGDVDDATGPIRTKRKKKATNVAFVRGDIISFATGTGVLATASTHGPYGICHKDAPTGVLEVEVFWNTKATIYIKLGANCIYDSYVTVGANKALPFVYTGTPTVPTLLLGQLVKPGATIYDGVQQPTAVSVDGDIGGIILGFQ